MGLALIDTNTLSSIGTAIRSKTGETANYKPSQMAEAINSITAGAEVPEEALVLSGDLSFYNVNGNWDWFINTYGDKIRTENISNLQSAFKNSSCEIPFEINITKSTGYLLQIDNVFNNSNISEVPVINGNIECANKAFCDCKATRFRSDLYFNHSDVDCFGIFAGMRNLLELPYLYNLKAVSDLNGMFSGCYKIKSIPEDYADTWTIKRKYAANGDFMDCYSLRNIPVGVLNKLFSNCPKYTGIFYNCLALEAVENFPVTTQIYSGSALTSAEMTTNMFYFYVSGGIVHNFVYGCGRLSKFTFAETAEEVKWSNQTIHFTEVGYDREAYIAGRGLGEFTVNNQVYDDITYAALKDTDDWWTADINYSRYNKVSALETIESLPDTSAFGTNTIMFRTAQGALTDGGAIGSLTAEEIAVASAKGWTVGLA